MSSDHTSSTSSLSCSLPTPELPAHARDVLESIQPWFRMTDDAQHKIVLQFLEDFERGLQSYGEQMAMVPSYVTAVPDGTERGTFLALDLGGTNLRVCEVKLLGNKSFEIRQQKYRVSDVLKTGEATALFDYMADSVDAFLTDRPPNLTADEDDLHLGFTFSFPVEQTALARGKLLTWTKGFSAKNAVGEDVGKMLQDAFDRKYMHVKCVALVNDTVGTLLSRAYAGGGCLLGAIFGTGTNGAYVEDVARIPKLSLDPATSKNSKMIINCEWGAAFSSLREVLPTTPFDNKLDRESINVKKQAFEKFISGMYLGEILRNMLLSLIDHQPPILFGGSSTPELNKHYGVDTAVMSDVELATSIAEIQDAVIKGFGLAKDNVSATDAWIVRWACELVGGRAAMLSGCAVAATLAQTGHARVAGQRGREDQSLKTPETIQVGVDGSMIEFYPRFEERLRASLRILVGDEVEKRVVIALARDGSGVGAALCAMQATKQ